MNTKYKPTVSNSKITHGKHHERNDFNNDTIGFSWWSHHGFKESLLCFFVGLFLRNFYEVFVKQPHREERGEGAMSTWVAELGVASVWLDGRILPEWAGLVVPYFEEGHDE